MSNPLDETQLQECKRAIHEEEQLQHMTQLFKVLGDMTRLKIMTLLVEKDEMSVEDIVRCMEMEQSAISHQLRKLKSLHVVKSRKNGKYVLYSLDDEHILTLYHLAKEHTNEKK